MLSKCPSTSRTITNSVRKPKSKENTYHNEYGQQKNSQNVDYSSNRKKLYNSNSGKKSFISSKKIIQQTLNGDSAVGGVKDDEYYPLRGQSSAACFPNQKT